ncbi:thiamine phosphate synthase [Solilutibacter silvestris]|uniref:Thiamine-phosphate synthase n=1 Tax=Solilutibacter silvestris TaxID=1645665 RepID=A0A2K1Q078_9GAMM|nr:thiamine phosphate synthase [Lysobacter silvestris]PNS08441.1 thiE: thiamine-phosphate pyrophosphorylase [Lysobacter silvestris]
MPARGLYLITPEDGDTLRLVQRVRALLQFAALLQYRDKLADPGSRLERAQALQALCAEFHVPLIINDDVELAAAVTAAGVHLGEDDGAIATARVRLGSDAIIGASCYDSIELARTAAAQGADYIAFGALFPSSTKPHARKATPQLFAAAAPLGVPRVAIGGITPDNVRMAVAAGADLVAVISGVFDATDPVSAARACAAAFD